MEVERLLRRERPDGPGAREEYLQEQRRAELAGPGKEHHRAREPDVERRDARQQAEPVTVLERVEQERERVGHDAVLAQEIEARAEAARPFVPDDDADRSEVERRELEAVALAESPDVCQPILAPDGPRRVARIREDARRPHQLEGSAVQCRVVEPLHSRDRIARRVVEIYIALRSQKNVISISSGDIFATQRRPKVKNSLPGTQIELAFGDGEDHLMPHS